MSNFQSLNQLIPEKSLNVLKDSKNTISYGPQLEKLNKKKPSKTKKDIKVKKINKIKIVATIGPKTANKKMLKQLFNAGMTLARLNGSHNTLEWHSNTIKLIKETIPDCPILLDIPGKKIRTSKLSFEPKFDVGDTIILTTEDGYDGFKKISITNNILHKFIKKDHIVYADDGTLKFKVVKVSKKDIYIKAYVTGTLKSSKGINIPHLEMKETTLSCKDKKIIDFAISNKVDFIGLSFIESAKSLNKVRDFIKSDIPKLVAKIENRKGLENLEEIVKATDCIMIDRGDLSTETDIESLAINQKKIIKTSLRFCKPVIVATEMLNNMITQPHPTKAEILDIYNSVKDGATATMLSGETAVGKYPLEAVKIMSSIANSCILENNNNTIDNNEHISMAKAIKGLCQDMPITKVVIVTMLGFAARVVSSQSIKQPILAITNKKDTAKTFNIFSNTKGFFYNTKFYKDSLEHIPECLKYLWEINELNKKDSILVVALSYPLSGKRMNLIQTHNVKDLKKLFHWK
jgi:pyruvate kinase